MQTNSITTEFKRKRPVGIKGWYWKLDWDMLDSSWNGHNWSWNSSYSSWHNWTWQSYYASSTSNRVEIPNSNELYMENWQSFSLWFWIKPTYSSGQSVTKGVISMTQNIDSTQWWSIHNDSVSRKREFRTKVSWQSQNAKQLSNLTRSSNERFHFVITYDWSTLKYYKNGTLLWSFSYTIWNANTTYPLYIWYASTWNATWSAYYEDVFFMKNYCLSQTEITKIYQDT